MPKTSNKKTTPAPAPAPASKNAAKKPSKKAKKVETPAPAQVVFETPVVDTPVDTPIVSPEPVESYDSEFTFISEQLKNALTIIKELTVKFNSLEKRVNRDQRVMNKKMKGRVKRVHDPNKPLSGFAKPGPVSDELRKFFNLSKDELISRTEVTKRFTLYCKAHDLQNVDDKRTIEPNAAVMKLLRLNKDSELLTFFNLQKYMKVHYPNKEGVYTH